jgi:oligopeptide/dipeptide ABC transporter ATP-binding protein
MYLGQLVELAGVGELFGNPSHPYTRALLDAIPTMDPNRKQRQPKVGMETAVPVLPEFCIFQPRCPQAQPGCEKVQPELREISPGHWVKCLAYDRSLHSL